MVTKSPLVPLRTSAALTGSFVQSTGVKCEGSRLLEVLVSYTRGTTGGAFKCKVLVSDDGVTYYERTVVDGASISAGEVNTYTAVYKFPVATTGSPELRTLVVDVSSARYVALSFAEYGATGTPGTLAASGVLSSA